MGWRDSDLSWFGGLGFGVWDLGFGIWGLGCGVWGLEMGFEVSGVGSEYRGERLSVKQYDSGFRLDGLGLRAEGFRFKVWGLRSLLFPPREGPIAASGAHRELLVNSSYLGSR